MSIRFTRTMSNQSIRDKIKGAFAVSNFTVLECDVTGHQLVKAADQDINGDELVARKGCLYLCEVFPEVSYALCFT